MTTMDEWLERLRTAFVASMPKEEDRALVLANLAFAVSRECLAGHRIPPPPMTSNSPEKREERRKRVIELLGKGVPEAEVATRLGVHRSTVNRIRHKTESPSQAA